MMLLQFVAKPIAADAQDTSGLGLITASPFERLQNKHAFLPCQRISLTPLASSWIG